MPVLEEFQPPARSPTNLPDWMTSKAPIIRAQPLTGGLLSPHYSRSLLSTLEGAVPCKVVQVDFWCQPCKRHVVYRAAHGGPNAAGAALHPHCEEV